MCKGFKTPPGAPLGISQYELGCGVQVYFIGKKEVMKPMVKGDESFQKVVSVVE